MKKIYDNNYDDGREEIDEQMEELKEGEQRKEDKRQEKLRRLKEIIEEERRRNAVFIGGTENKDDLEEIKYPRLRTEIFKVEKKGAVRGIMGLLGLGFLMNKKGKKSDKQLSSDLKQPLLFLMRSNGYIDVIEGLKVNSLFTLDDEGSKKKKGIILTPKKLQTLNLEPYPKCWIANEDEMLPYPQDINFDAGEFVQIVRKIETTKGLLKDESALLNAKMWFWLAIIGIVLTGLYFAFREGWFTQIFGKIILSII